MPKATPDDIIVYIYEKGPVRAKDLEQEFVKTKRVSRGTLYKYKKLLEADGKIKATLVYARPPYFTYHVPPKHHPEVEVLIQYRSLSESLFLNTKEVAWEDTPLGFYLTNVKQKVLWSDARTGAMMVINKIPIGLSEPVHYHPNANEWGLGVSGELERFDGTRINLQGVFSFVPRGDVHGVGRLTKESIAFVYWDGPRTKIPVQGRKRE